MSRDQSAGEDTKKLAIFIVVMLPVVLVIFSLPSLI